MGDTWETYFLTWQWGAIRYAISKPILEVLLDENVENVTQTKECDKVNVKRVNGTEEHKMLVQE